MSDLLMCQNRIPELLSPAGSPEAFYAALEGGADAVYMGGPVFNARANARNFSFDEMAEAVKTAHVYGTKVYMTLNIQMYDKELSAFLDAAKQAYHIGVDALIVADLGGAKLIHRALPDFPLHASTQMSGHNLGEATLLSQMGFERMVCARELSLSNVRYLCRQSPIEIEMFVHGALCVCHSGQCLFSSLVGGRSGNRGECAQPCRLPYRMEMNCANGGEIENLAHNYPLSLKDLSLAHYVPELLSIGVSSLKIEGRMKAPEYVYGVTKIWRRLLDEKRRATPKEEKILCDLFSRGGFTQGYFLHKIDKRMLGIRNDVDKEQSHKAEPFLGLKRKMPISLKVQIQKGQPISSTVVLARGNEVISADGIGFVPEIAQKTPITKEDVIKNISKWGNTPFVPTDIQVILDEGLMVPVSQMNALRRSVGEALLQKAGAVQRKAVMISNEIDADTKSGNKEIVEKDTAVFYDSLQITAKAKDRFAIRFLPLMGKDCHHWQGATGVAVPPVIMDDECEIIQNALHEAKEKGIRYALVGNLGHCKIVADFGFTVIWDYRLNVFNTETAAILKNRGVAVVLSPELSLPQMRDIIGHTPGARPIIYGRVPLMTLEKCILKDSATCEKCAQDKGKITDRRRVTFPVLREWEHRNVIYNSVPFWMGDRRELLQKYGIACGHYIFSVETPKEVDSVIDAYSRGRGPLSDEAIRRIPT